MRKRMIAGNCLSALCKLIKLKDTHRSVPENGLCALDGIGIELNRMGMDIGPKMVEEELEKAEFTLPYGKAYTIGWLPSEAELKDVRAQVEELVQ